MQSPEHSHFDLGYRLGVFHHRIKMVEDKLANWERYMKRGLLVFALSLIGSILNVFPGALAKTLHSIVVQAQQLLTSF